MCHCALKVGHENVDKVVWVDALGRRLVRLGRAERHEQRDNFVVEGGGGGRAVAWLWVIGQSERARTIVAWR